MAGSGPIMSGPGRESPIPEGAEPAGWMIVSSERRGVTTMIPCGPGPPGASSSVTARGRYATFLRRA
jgi:hypothetical protein